MTDLLKIGVSALLAQQRALATTSNNIANASTPGYSRQRVEFSERATDRLGNESVGSGVQISTIRRLTDDILATQLRAATSGLNRAEVFVGLAESLDDLLAGADGGLTGSLQSFVNAWHDLANDPSSAASRQALLSETQTLLARFEFMDQRLTAVGDEIRSRLTASAAEISDLGAGIANLNRQLIVAGRAQPPELLDQRDQLLERLAGLVQVSTAVQSDGSLSVFVGSGQTLVLGTDSATIAVAPGATDPDELRIVLKGLGSTVDITRFLSGGEVGGLLDFNREMLSPTRNELGRIATALVATVNAQHRSGLDAEGRLGSDFFAIGSPESFAAAGNTGSGVATVTIADVAVLQPTNYALSFDGTNYLLTRADNGSVVPLTGAGTVANPLVADGLSIVMSGAPAAGDYFLLKPLERAAGTVSLLLTRGTDIAAAAPTRTQISLANTGTGAISTGQVIDATDPNLLTTATIQFLTATTYSINGAGSFAYTPGANIDINGTRVQINGTPAVNDQFVIESNVGGTDDNRNVQALVGRLGGGVFSGNVSLRGAAASLVTNVGARTAAMNNQRDAQQFVTQQSREKLESIRGVNLDEEAADMLRYEQLYQAAAQTLAVAGSLFNTLLAALGR